jgi:hypothetical protein
MLRVDLAGEFPHRARSIEFSFERAARLDFEGLLARGSVVEMRKSRKSTSFLADCGDRRDRARAAREPRDRHFSEFPNFADSSPGASVLRLGTDLTKNRG